MPAPSDKPKRIKSILDYLQQDVPKVGGNQESVEGENLLSDSPPEDIDDAEKAKRKRPTKLY